MALPENMILVLPGTKKSDGLNIPAGGKTALAVEHFLKRNSSGAVAPYTFYDEHYLKFSRGKLNDFEGMSRYLQGLWLWRAGSLFLVLCGRVTSPSVCSERGL